MMSRIWKPCSGGSTGITGGVSMLRAHGNVSLDVARAALAQAAQARRRPWRPYYGGRRHAYIGAKNAGGWAMGGG